MNFKDYLNVINESSDWIKDASTDFLKKYLKKFKNTSPELKHNIQIELQSRSSKKSSDKPDFYSWLKGKDFANLETKQKSPFISLPVSQKLSIKKDFLFKVKTCWQVGHSGLF